MPFGAEAYVVPPAFAAVLKPFVPCDHGAHSPQSFPLANDERASDEEGRTTPPEGRFSASDVPPRSLRCGEDFHLACLAALNPNVVLPAFAAAFKPFVLCGRSANSLRPFPIFLPLRLGQVTTPLGELALPIR